MPDLSREQVEEMVDNNTAPMDGTLEDGIRMLSMPDILTPLFMLREAIKTFNEAAVCGCEDEGCLAKGLHRQMLDAYHQDLPELEKLKDKMREDIIDGIYSVAHCKCSTCTSIEKSLAAIFN